MNSSLGDPDFPHEPSSLGFEDEADQTDGRTDDHPVGIRADEVEDVKRYSIIATYHDVWREFYDWEQEYSARELQNISATEPMLFDFYLDSDMESDDMNIDDGDAGTGKGAVSITICTWDHFGDFSKERALAHIPHEIVAARTMRKQYDAFQEHRSYESCTPSSGYIFPNIAPDGITCEFIKYGDAVAFDSRRFLRYFYSIGWQDEWRDPDRKH